MSKTSTAYRTSRQAAAELTGPASLAGAAVAMTLTDGSRVHFASCHHCENRWWLQDDAPLTFDHVIAKTRKIA